MHASARETWCENLSMVRRDVEQGVIPAGGVPSLACCATPTGASPVPVGVGAPGSRPQVLEGDLCARAGRQEPTSGGEQARGPQHEVKPAASTDLQPAGRAAHVTAKATSPGRAPKRAGGCGGVGGAARVQGVVWNTRGPSARPESGQARSYKPKAKSSRAQRESEGIVVPKGEVQAESTKAVRHNAAGGKGPCGGYAEDAGKREGLAGETGPRNPVGQQAHAKVRQLQRQLGPQPSGHRPEVDPLRSAGTYSGVTSTGRHGAPLSGAALLATEGRVMLRADTPPVSRVREIRMHGLKGGVGSRTGLWPY
jgi:hypothetical protein